MLSVDGQEVRGPVAIEQCLHVGAMPVEMVLADDAPDWSAMVAHDTDANLVVVTAHVLVRGVPGRPVEGETRLQDHQGMRQEHHAAGDEGSPGCGYHSGKGAECGAGQPAVVMAAPAQNDSCAKKEIQDLECRTLAQQALLVRDIGCAYCQAFRDTQGLYLYV